MREFKDIFASSKEDQGRTTLVHHEIQTEGPPIRLPYRRQNPIIRAEEATQVQQMLDTGVIRPSQSPWASPIVMVRKKDGGHRFCIDFRQLNSATVKDAMPLPRIDDLLDALLGATWFTTLDLMDGYHQVPIKEEDKAKTAFRTSNGRLFEFNQVPFGLTNAPATFSRLMDKVLDGLAWETCLYYLDDVIIFSSTWEEHLNRLRDVFLRLRAAGLKLSPKKCVMAAKEVRYLGHCVSYDGIRPDPDLLQAIQDIPPPANPKELRSFLGLASYYRRFVKDFAKIAAPLHCLLQKGTEYQWDQTCQQAFLQLKQILTSNPITAYPDFTQPFRLYTDASGVGLGAILAQVQNGKERIICCASRSLNNSERRYPATKLECLALVWAVEKFRPYLTAVPFEVYTDHYALQWLRTMKTGAAVLHRWSATLEAFNFTVKHRPGRSQGHVDALSRLPQAPAPPDEVVFLVQPLQSKAEAIEKAKELHEATHIGGENLWRLFQKRYSFPRGRSICLDVAKACRACQRGTDYGPKKAPLGTISSSGPWDTLSVDIVGPLPRDHQCEFLVVFVDCFSRYTVLVPVKDHTAPTVSNALIQHVVSYFGVPRRILSDRGREFTGALWQNLLKTLGSHRLLTSPYHPEGNAINERSHRTIMNVMRALQQDGQVPLGWTRLLPQIMLTLNSLPHAPHHYSSSLIATGREALLPPDLLLPASNPPPDHQDYVDQLRRQMQDVHKQLRVPEAPIKPNPYAIGDSIWVQTTPPERTSKLSAKWKGPYTILEVPNAYQVTYSTPQGPRLVHINHTKPAHPWHPPVASSPPRPTQHPLGYLPSGYNHASPPTRTPLPPAPVPTQAPPASPATHLAFPASQTQGPATAPLPTPPSPAASSSPSSKHCPSPNGLPHTTRCGRPVRRPARYNHMVQTIPALMDLQVLPPPQLQNRGRLLRPKRGRCKKKKKNTRKRSHYNPSLFHPTTTRWPAPPSSSHQPNSSHWPSSAPNQWLKRQPSSSERHSCWQQPAVSTARKRQSSFQQSTLACPRDFGLPGSSPAGSCRRDSSFCTDWRSCPCRPRPLSPPQRRR